MHYSIIMPVYNGRDYFEQALISAIKSLGLGDEIIVVEDGSTDGGVESIVKRYQANGEISYLVKENGGVASALNLGMKHSSREIFAWLSHDDLYLPNRLEADRELRAHSPNIITVSNFFLLNNDSGFLRYINSITNLNSRQRFRLLSRRFLNGNCLSAPVSLLKESGGFNEQLRHTQDYDLWLRLLQKQEFVAIPAPTVLSRQHPMQDTQAQPAISKREYKGLLRKYLRVSDFLDPRNVFDFIRLIKSLLY